MLGRSREYLAEVLDRGGGRLRRGAPALSDLGRYLGGHFHGHRLAYGVTVLAVGPWLGTAGYVLAYAYAGCLVLGYVLTDRGTEHRDRDRDSHRDRPRRRNGRSGYG